MDLLNFLVWILFFFLVVRLFRVFMPSETKLPQEPLEDLQVCLKVLKKTTRYLWAGIVFMLSPGIREDICILYAFCRLTDDMIDCDATPEAGAEKLNLIHKFLNQVFSDRDLSPSTDSWIYGLRRKRGACEPSVNWPEFEPVLTKEQLAAFRCLSRIVHYLPPKPFFELLAGYEWDLNKRVIRSEDDFIQYAEYVASSVVVLSTYVLCVKSGMVGLRQAQHGEMIQRAREMGIVLHLIDVARDIVIDSEELGRCYIPKSYLKYPEKELRILTETRTPWALGPEVLRSYAIRLLDLAENYKKNATSGLLLLPKSTLKPVIYAIHYVWAVGTAIRKNKSYLRKATVSRWLMIWTLIRYIFFPIPSIQSSK